MKSLSVLKMGAGIIQLVGRPMVTIVLLLAVRDMGKYYRIRQGRDRAEDQELLPSQR